MTRRTYTRRLGKEWGTLAYLAAHARGGERLKAQARLRAYVAERLREGR